MTKDEQTRGKEEEEEKDKEVLNLMFGKELLASVGDY